MDNKNNTGDRNTGYFNTGDWNTGNWNTGHCNTGDHNTGDWNTGYRNTGYRNTGSWNTGSHNTGYFNTDTPKTIRVFGKECIKEDWDKAEKPDFIYFDLTEFIEESEMTDIEKKEHPEYKTIGGYLKVYEYKEAFKKSWDNATDEDRQLIFNLPNFDAEIFKEISGIDVNEKVKELTVSEIENLLGYKVKIVK